MFRRFFVGILLLFFIFTLAPTSMVFGGSDQDLVCKVLLCMANPGGATQFQECVPPVNEFIRRTSRGEHLPSCGGASAQGYSMMQGVQPFFTCEQSYGPEYKPHNLPSDYDTENGCNANPTFGRRSNYPDGYAYNECTQCIKSLGVRKVYECNNDESGTCHWVDKEIFDRKPAQRNAKQRFIEAQKDGQAVAQRHYW